MNAKPRWSVHTVTGLKLEKEVWSDEDFDVMGWHDATVHGLAFNPYEWSLALDLDYIFKWVTPPRGQERYKFWVAPVTMHFEAVSDIRFDFPWTPFERLEIADLYREKTDPKVDGEKPRFRYRFDCHVGEISLMSHGFQMFVRHAPVLGYGQDYAPKNRGGYCFDRTTASEQAAQGR